MDEERKRRRRSIFDIFDSFFSDIWEEIEELERKLMHSFRISEDIEEIMKSKKPIIYGFRIEIGPDGKPRVYEFGNVKRLGKERPRIVVSEETEPLTDVIQEDDIIRVIVEMPGVDKDKIKIRAIDDRHIIVEASNHDRRYRKEIELPVETDIDKAKASYRNGVLEIRLPIKRPIREEKGKTIEIE